MKTVRLSDLAAFAKINTNVVVYAMDSAEVAEAVWAADSLRRDGLTVVTAGWEDYEEKLTAFAMMLREARDARKVLVVYKGCFESYQNCEQIFFEAAVAVAKCQVKVLKNREEPAW